MWRSEAEAYAYHRWLVMELNESQREAYDYIVKCGSRGATADDLFQDLDLVSGTAGNVMHHLAWPGLVRVGGRRPTGNEGTAKYYVVSHPMEMPPPPPPRVHQSWEDKWTALQEAAVVINHFIRTHPEGKELLMLRDDGDPEFSRFLTLLGNVHHSTELAMRKKDEENS